MTIGPPKGPNHKQNVEINRIYEDFAERNDLATLLLDIAREYWLVGSVYIWHEWDDELKEWSECFVLPAEYCFHPNSQVTMADGTWKAIKDIRVGERVIDHQGKPRAVLETHKNPSRGTLLEISAFGLPNKLRVTPEHPVYVWRDSEIISEEENFFQSGGVAVEVQTQQRQAVKIPAKAIRPGDWLISPKMGEEIPQDDIDADLCNLMGWYLAEGSLYRGTSDTVIFTLGHTEKREAEEIARLLEKCFPPEISYGKRFNQPRDWQTNTELKPVRKPLDWYSGPCPACNAPNKYLYNKGPDRRSGLEKRARCKNCGHMSDPRVPKSFNRAIVKDPHPHYGTIVRYVNQAAFKFFEEEAGTGAYEKVLTERWIHLPKEQQKVLLRAYWDGDGCDRPNGSMTSATVSRKLAAQLRLMTLRVGLWNRWRPSINRKTVSLVEYDSDTQKSVRSRPKIHFNETPARYFSKLNDPSYEPGEYAFYPVSNITEVEYTGDVYNLTVEETHSLMVEGVSAGNCHSLIHPFKRNQEIIFFARPLVDTAAVRRMTDRDLYLTSSSDNLADLFAELEDDIPEELRDALDFGEGVPLNTDPAQGSFVYHLARNRPPNEQYGVSLIERCLETLFRLENLKNAQLQISSRNMQPKLLIYADGITPPQLDDLRGQVDLALLEQADYPIITNYSVEWQTIGANDRLLQVDTEYQTLREDLATGLGTTKEMLTGAATYGGQRITLELQNTQYLVFRELMKNYVEKVLFRPMAEAKGHFFFEEIETWIKIEPEEIVPGDDILQQHDGTLRRRVMQINKIYNHSTLRFNRLSIRDNVEVYDQLFQLHQKGSLALRYLLDLHNIDSEENETALLEDLGTIKDPVFNRLMESIYPEVAPVITQQTDFVRRVIEGLNLDVQSQARGEPAPGGGGVGGLGPGLDMFPSGGSDIGLGGADLGLPPTGGELGLPPTGSGLGLDDTSLGAPPAGDLGSPSAPVTANRLASVVTEKIKGGPVKLPGKLLSSSTIKSILKNRPKGKTRSKAVNHNAGDDYGDS